MEDIGQYTIAHQHRSQTDIQLLIFDFDGTLIDSKVDIATSVNLTLTELGLPCRSPEEIFSFVGDGVKRLLRLSVGEDNLTLYEQALRAFRGHYIAHCVDTTKFYPGIDAVMHHFSDHVKAIATNKSLDYTLRILEGLGRRDDFAVVECPQDSTELKPDPAMLLKILHTLDVQPEQAVLIGDSTNDVRAAQAAGVKACAVGYGYGNRDKVAALKPDFFCERPEELMALFRLSIPLK
ncbi:MAG: HAD-IA family hydrolase [Nitrospirales bacterium]|nr:HAD-IA family hydrolase [Nitrospirales bacterium]